jgi:deoxyribose-phosphate aldolase
MVPIQINEFIDHTNLKPEATKADIEKLCREAMEYQFASVCINPCYVSLAERLLRDSRTNICTVIGFPLGATTTEAKNMEASLACSEGADEFDMVINVGALKDGRIDYILRDISGVMLAAKGRTVKLIIETGLLTEDEKVLACQLATKAGVDFVKTCTGMTRGQATVEDIRLIKANVDPEMEIKASGGIRTYEQAIALIEAGATRIGTSSGIAIMEGSKQF